MILGESAESRPKEVTLVTSMGDLKVELYWDHASKTCENFYQLCRQGYYDGTLFHRIVQDFIIQGGDPTGTGRGGHSIYGEYFEDEIHPKLRHTGAGIFSMANAGTPHTNGSQFFITLAPCPFLDGTHTIFGRVCEGMNVVKKLSLIKTNAVNQPLFDVKIIRASTAVEEKSLLVS